MIGFSGVIGGKGWRERYGVIFLFCLTLGPGQEVGLGSGLYKGEWALRYLFGELGLG